MHAYLSIGVTSGYRDGAVRGAWRGASSGIGGASMQDLGYELPRIPIPRTTVNKGKKKGQGALHQKSILNQK